MRKPVSGQSSFSSVIMKLLWQMKCTVMRAHTLKLRFIGKSKICFPTPPVSLRPVTDPADVPVHREAVSPTRCIGLHETAACMQLRRQIQGRLGESFRRRSKSLRFSPVLFFIASKT